MKVATFVVAVFLGVTTAAIVRRQAAQAFYDLPAGAELIIPNLKMTFSCDGRIYGYYADVDNDCQVFHVCVPTKNEYGQTVTTMYSFFCGNQTVFDQANLVCANQGDVTPCSEATSLYSVVNERFGVTAAAPPVAQ